MEPVRHHIDAMNISPNPLSRYFNGKTNVKEEKIIENPATGLRIEVFISKSKPRLLLNHCSYAPLKQV
jgi:hypothetical protein